MNDARPSPSPSGEYARDQKMPVAVSGIFLGAENSDAAPHRGVFEARNSVLERVASTPQIVTNITFFVVELAVLGATAQLIAHEGILDTCLLDPPEDLATVEMRSVLRYGLRAHIRECFDIIGLKASQHIFEGTIRMANRKNIVLSGV